MMNYFFKQVLRSKLKDLPKDQQDKIFSAIEKDPDFFKELAIKIQEKIKSGKDQQSAVMEILMENKEKFQSLLS